MEVRNSYIGTDEYCKTISFSEHDGNGGKHNVTAVIKVRDRPGGLWEVLDKIGVSLYCMLIVSQVTLVISRGRRGSQTFDVLLLPE